MFFGNISKISRGTIKYHSLKEAEIHRILFDTGVEEIRPLLFSQSGREYIWSVSQLNIGCNGPYSLFEKAVSENRFRIVNNQDRLAYDTSLQSLSSVLYVFIASLLF